MKKGNKLNRLFNAEWGKVKGKFKKLTSKGRRKYLIKLVKDQLNY